MFDTVGRGFWITFANGFRVSIQWSYGTYCKDRGKNPGSVSLDAEVAVFNPKGEMVNIDGPDTVAGWVNPDEAVNLMKIVSELQEDAYFDENHPLKFR